MTRHVHAWPSSWSVAVVNIPVIGFENASRKKLQDFRRRLTICGRSCYALETKKPISRIVVCRSPEARLARSHVEKSKPR
jgi:hypothetical protein